MSAGSYKVADSLGEVSAHGVYRLTSQLDASISKSDCPAEYVFLTPI